MTEPTREQREAALLANLEADRIIYQAKRAENGLLLVVVALIVAFLVGFSFLHATPADAAKRAAYKGTVTICYSPSAKSDPFGMYLTKQWSDVLPAAVKAAKVGKVKIVKEKYPLTSCYGEVHIGSGPYAEVYGQPVTKTAVWRVYKYGEAGVMWESQVSMSDKVGAKLTKAQRQAQLVKALKVAIPR